MLILQFCFREFGWQLCAGHGPASSRPKLQTDMLQEAAPANRWTAKILAYPCFDRPFVEAPLRTRLSNLQLVLAMEVDSPGAFAAKAFE